jgi:DNA-binding NtrC family response regulator
VRLDVRVIAATNRDLRQEVNRGRFRTDLLYRLNTVRLRVPPLRERRDDIGVLAGHFWTQFANDPHAAPPAELLIDWLRRDWPGNVRELRSAVERAVLLDDPSIWAEISTTVAVPEIAGAAPARLRRGGVVPRRQGAGGGVVGARLRARAGAPARRQPVARGAGGAHGSEPPARALAPARRVDHRRVAAGAGLRRRIARVSADARGSLRS